MLSSYDIWIGKALLGKLWHPIHQHQELGTFSLHSQLFYVLPFFFTASEPPPLHRAEPTTM